jgi:hypothetical protein
VIIGIEPVMECYLTPSNHLLNLVLPICVSVENGDDAVYVPFLKLVHMVVENTDAPEIEVAFLWAVGNLRADEAEIN